MKLRPYQNDAVSTAVNMLSERDNSLIVAGTGAGKTIMMAAAIGRFFNGFRAVNKRSPHILVLVHRTEIHTQNHSKFSLVCPNIATSEITAQRKSLHGYIHFGMVQTVHNLLPEFEKAGSYFDLIVIDEAHHSAASTYEEIIDWNRLGNPKAALLGVTATPNRGDELPLIHLFDNYYQISTKFLIDSHFLVRPTFLDYSPVFELTDKDGKPYAETGHLAKNCKNDLPGREIINDLVDKYLALKEPGKSIIFAPNHEFCERIYARLKELDRKPAYLSPGIDEISRKEELERFEKGDSEELINVDICTEGYDFPELRNLVDFDTNGTHGQWVQKVGRVLRTAPGKTSCTVSDFGGNVQLYPEGVETTVLLEGAAKNEKGKHLQMSDFLKKKPAEEKGTAVYQQADTQTYTPYHLPEGFESVNDKDFGIAFVCCGKDKDAIMVERNNSYVLYIGDKAKISRNFVGTFEDCINMAVVAVGKQEKRDRPISNLQIKMLAPEYPTTALDWDGANCCICFKTWKKEIAEDMT